MLFRNVLGLLIFNRVTNLDFLCSPLILNVDNEFKNKQTNELLTMLTTKQTCEPDAAPRWQPLTLPHTIGSFLCRVWRLVPSQSSQFIWRPKCTSRLESQTTCPPLPLSHAPPPQLPPVPFQSPPCHRKGWLVGEGKRQRLGLHCNPRGADGSSPLHLGVLEQCIYLLHQGRPPGFQTGRLSDARGPSRSSRTTPIRSLTSEQ